MTVVSVFLVYELLGLGVVSQLVLGLVDSSVAFFEEDLNYVIS